MTPVIVSAVYCLIRITLLIIVAGPVVASVPLLSQFFKVTELLCLVGNKKVIHLESTILHLYRHHALQLTIYHAHL